MHPNQPLARGCIMLFYMQFIAFATAPGFFVCGLSFAYYTETFRFFTLGLYGMFPYTQC